MSGDNELSTCAGQDSESWEEEFFASIASESDEPPEPVEEEEPDDSMFVYVLYKYSNLNKKPLS